jgi:hypothetical protein
MSNYSYSSYKSNSSSANDTTNNLITSSTNGSMKSSESYNQLVSEKIASDLISMSLKKTKNHQQKSSQSVELSPIERQILNSQTPLNVNESEEIEVNFQGKKERGIWLNRSENINWKGNSFNIDNHK